MDKIFKALADETRRTLLDRLYEKQGQTLGEMCKGTNMQRQSATKHLKILEVAGLITIKWKGREKLHFLNPIPIGEISDRWIDKFSKPKVEAILNLKSALENKSHNKENKRTEHD